MTNLPPSIFIGDLVRALKALQPRTPTTQAAILRMLGVEVSESVIPGLPLPSAAAAPALVVPTTPLVVTPAPPTPPPPAEETYLRITLIPDATRAIPHFTTDPLPQEGMLTSV